MVYFVDLIFFAERLFILTEVLGIKVSENQIREYMYILHDWIDDIVNQRDDRVKSERYKKVLKAKEGNDYLKRAVCTEESMRQNRASGYLSTERQ